MSHRIVIVGVLVAFVTTMLPANVFAEDSHPLASLRTSAGLSKALQAGQAPSPKEAMRPPSKGVRAQAQQGSGPFLSSTGGRVALAALIAVGVGVVVATWDRPKPRLINE